MNQEIKIIDQEIKIMNQEEIKKFCEENKNFKNWYLSQNEAKSVEKAFKKQKYQEIKYQKYKKEEEKIKIFENKDIEYLSTLLKKLKKIFNKAKKDHDIKQLKYLNQKISNLMKDKNYIRINFNNGIIGNKICRDFSKIQINVREEIKLQGEN